MSDEQPHILFVTTSFPLHADHWSGVFVAVQARALAKSGCKVTVLAPDAAGVKTHEPMGPLDVYRFRYLPDAAEKLAYGGGIPANLQASPWLWGTVPAFTAGLFRALSHLAKKADLVHAHWSFAGAVASLTPAVRHKPLVVSFHGSDLAKTGGVFSKAAKRVCRSANAVVVHSDEMKQRAINAGAASDSILQLPHGVETESFPPKQKNGDSFKLIAVGRLSEEKGFDLLLDALADMADQPKWSLQIVGEGPLLSSLHQQIEHLGMTNRITLSGALAPSQVRRELSRSDLMIVPSRREGFGVVGLEGMAAGLPVVATRVGALPEIIEDGKTGVLVDANDVKALHTAIVDMLVDEEKGLSMGKKGRIRVQKKYAAEVVNQPLVTLYHQLIAGS